MKKMGQGKLAQMGQFYVAVYTGDRIARDPLNVGVVGVRLAMCEAVQRRDDLIRIAEVSHVVERAGCVLDQVVQHGDNLVDGALDAQHDPEGMQDEWFTAGRGINLAPMRACRKRNGIFERRGR